MHVKTIIGDSTYFSSSFVSEYGVYVGYPTSKKPYIPHSYSLIADMLVEIDAYTAVPLTQDVSLDIDYQDCRDRFLKDQKAKFKTSVKLYLVKKSDIANCETEYISEDHVWPWEQELNNQNTE